MRASPIRVPRPRGGCTRAGVIELTLRRLSEGSWGSWGSRLLRKKQHSAADLPSFKRRMGLSRVCQRVGAIDSDGKFSLLDPGHKLPEVVRVLLHVRQT